MKDLFGNEVKESAFARTPEEIRKERNRKYSRPRGHAAPPGSGPEGETCKTCKHCTVYKGNSRNFTKCDLVKKTNGPATDIRQRDPACSRWEKEDAADEVQR